MGSEPIRRLESSLSAPGGLRLFRRAWLPEAPERVLVMVHGYAEHSGRYDHVGAWFAERGVAVHAYDQRGHGRSGGPRGHVDRFGDFLDDLESLLSTVREAHEGLPITLLGHSLGGLVTATLLVERAPEIAGAVLASSALALGEGVPAWRVAMARTLRRVVPRFAMPNDLDLDGLSRDPEVLREYLDDPLVFRTMTVSLGAEMLETAARTAAAAARVKVPVLLLHGEDDTLCAASGSAAFAEGLEAPGHALHIYPGLRHELLNEPEREQVLADVHAWLEGGDPG